MNLVPSRRFATSSMQATSTQSYALPRDPSSESYYERVMVVYIGNSSIPPPVLRLSPTRYRQAHAMWLARYASHRVLHVDPTEALDWTK